MIEDLSFGVGTFFAFLSFLLGFLIIFVRFIWKFASHQQSQDGKIKGLEEKVSSFEEKIKLLVKKIDEKNNSIEKDIQHIKVSIASIEAILKERIKK